METITSHQNPIIKQIRRLRQKKYRQREGVYFIEGLRLVLSAIESQVKIDRLVYCPELLTSKAGWQAIKSQEDRGVKAVTVGVDIFKKISTRDNPVGIGAIVAVQESSIQELQLQRDSIFIGLVQISDPGNLGTVIRTGNAAGVSGVILVEESVDPFHPTAVKASMGTLFTTPVCSVASSGALLEWAAVNGITTVASSARAEGSFWQVNYELPALLLVGSEQMGLSEQLLKKADIKVKIPMGGESSSLNLAVAAGLILYEMRRSTGEKMT
ncbi:MAG: RNA methyltransferase [Syntrophobacteria bacterium]